MKTTACVLFFLIVFTGQSVIAQTPAVLTGQLVDSLQQTVAYANLGVANTPVGTVADGQGRFTLYITDKVKPADTVHISLLGYLSLAFTVAELSSKLAGNSQLIMTEDAR